MATGLELRLISNYTFDGTSGGSTADERLAGRSDAIAAYFATMAKVSAACRPCLSHVVIHGGSAAGWATLRGHSVRVSGAIGLAFLKEALDELVAHFGY
jgi:hypothetical protein